MARKSNKPAATPARKGTAAVKKTARKAAAAPKVPAAPIVAAVAAAAETAAPVVHRGLALVMPAVLELPTPKTNPVQIGAMLAPEGKSVRMICYSINSHWGSKIVTFVEPESLTPFTIWTTHKVVMGKRMATGGVYAVNGSVKGLGKEYNGFAANNLENWTVEKMD